MKLIVGLGNPGPQYETTRHNVGFMAVQRLAQRHAITGSRLRFHAQVGEGLIQGHKCMLMLPQLFMNRSGLPVAEAVNFYKLDVCSDLMVVVDDVALPCGRIRLRGEGGAGGHNGLKDIEKALATKTYPRLRIGIDPPGRVNQADYVLSRFSPDQWQRIDIALDRACDAMESWIEQGLEKTMTVYNMQQSGETDCE